MSFDLQTWVLINKIIVVLVNVVGLWLIFASLFAKGSRRLNKFFFLFSLCLIVWVDMQFLSSFAQFFFSIDKSLLIALWAKRMVYAALSLFFIFFYYFSLYFPREGQHYRALDLTYVAFWIGLFCLSFTNLMISEIVSPSLITGAGEQVYFYATIFSVVVCFYNIFGKNRSLTSEEKMKIQSLLRGAIIFGAFESIPLQGIYAGSILGQYSLIFLLGFIAYAVNQKEIFEVKVILIELLLGLIAAILLVLPLMTDNLLLKVSHYVLFILFCVFFDVIMKSILTEFREKEILEQKVQQRTTELEDAKKNLEETNAVLEVRVRARTLELEKLNQTLEEKVRERTFDLQGKMKELERFNRLSVGRELKMIELKNRIRDLEKKEARTKGAVKTDKNQKKNETKKADGEDPMPFETVQI